MMGRALCWGLAIGLALAPGSVARAEPDLDQVEFFEAKIRPVLAGHCLGCLSWIKGSLDEVIGIDANRVFHDVASCLRITYARFTIAAGSRCSVALRAIVRPRPMLCGSNVEASQ